MSKDFAADRRALQVDLARLLATEVGVDYDASHSSRQDTFYWAAGEKIGAWTRSASAHPDRVPSTDQEIICEAVAASFREERRAQDEAWARRELLRNPPQPDLTTATLKIADQTTGLHIFIDVPAEWVRDAFGRPLAQDRLHEMRRHLDSALIAHPHS
ncbi:MAG TPA: hypothetical protein VHL98_11725 [Microvirga sp.]|jgi:hypothetical protein|nr:hypothetical protein [Microvirga sp.]